MTPEINALSLSVVKLTFVRVEEDKPLTVDLCVGTGFFVETAGDRYLVTNRHLVDGSVTKGGLPTRIEVAVKGTDPSKSAECAAEGRFNSTTVVVPLDLYDNADDPFCPKGHRWLTHPTIEEVDLIALPLAGGTLDPTVWTAAGTSLPKNPPLCIPLPSEDSPSPTADADVVIIGYPKSDYAPSHLYPIYKSGRIASEPQVPGIDGLPYFLVDGQTKTGLSGSPVMLRITKTRFRQEDGKLTAVSVIERSLIGVYASRAIGDVGRDQMELGKVWHADLIAEVINQKI